MTDAKKKMCVFKILYETFDDGKQNTTDAKSCIWDTTLGHLISFA
jgi:hypothetical protein